MKALLKRYKGEVIALLVVASMVILVGGGIQLKGYAEAESNKATDANNAAEYFQETGEDANKTQILGNTESLTNFGVSTAPWDGQMAVTLEGAQYYDTVDQARAAHPDANYNEREINYEPNAGMVMLQVKLHNINAEDYGPDSKTFFYISGFCLTIDGADKKEYLTQFKSPSAFSGTYDRSNVKDYYKFDLPQGETKTFTLGYLVNPKVKELVGSQDSDKQLKLEINSGTGIVYSTFPIELK